MRKRKRKEAEFRISLALPWLLRLPDSTYKGTHGRNQYLIVTKAEVKESAETEEGAGRVAFQPMTGELTRAAGAHVPGALLQFTEVRLGFSKRIQGAAVEQEDFNKVLAIAYGCLNIT